MRGADIVKPGQGRKPDLLASVATLAEVETATALGADILDLKDPTAGALGAWPRALLPRAVALVAGRRPVSATIGDLPMRPEVLAAAVRETAVGRVDLVKVGFFPDGDHLACAEALGRLAGRGVRLVAVLMADQRPDLGLLPTLAAAGFRGVMLDTAGTAGGGLRRHLDEAALRRFVAEARGLGLLVGLAGSLTLADIPPLAALGPDLLGFRSALCRGGREGPLDAAAFTAVRAALDRTAGQGHDGMRLDHESA